MALVCPLDFDVAKLRSETHETYDRLARDPSGEFHFHRGLAYASELLGYSRAELESLPALATEAFAGVGNPFVAGAVHAGDVVVDHACGAGTDLLLAAKAAGQTGRAVGVDMTPAMVERATRAAREAGLADRVEVKQGVYEELPLADSSVDVLISNGVLNLAPDKPRVMKEIVRVLRPGGRLLLADVVVARELKLEARRDPELWAACIAGALTESELIELATSEGLSGARVVARYDCFRETSAERKVSTDLHVHGASLFAEKPA